MNQDAYERGELDARSDIAVNKCRLFWGTRGAWGERFTELMRERFGVEVVHSGCFTSDDKSSYEQGYNKTIQAHLGDIFGAGSFERAWQEIEDYRLEQYRRWVASKKDT